MSLCGLPYGLPTSWSSVPDDQRHRALHRLDGLGRHRELVGVLAARERVQPRHRVERVLVDGVHVIDVVLHAARRRLPLGHQRRQQPEVLHLLEARRVGPVARVADEVDEARPGVGIGAQRLAVEAAPARRSSRACAAPAGRRSSIAAEKMRIISDGFCSNTDSSFGLERAVAHHEAGVDARRDARSTTGIVRAPVVVAQRSRAGAGARSRGESAWRARGTGASAPRPPGATAGRMSPSPALASGHSIGAIASCSAKRSWSWRRPAAGAWRCARAAATRARPGTPTARRSVITPLACSSRGSLVPKRAIAAQRPTQRSRMPPGPFFRSGSSRKMVSPKRLWRARCSARRRATKSSAAVAATRERNSARKRSASAWSPIRKRASSSAVAAARSRRRQRQRLVERADGVAGVDLGVPERVQDGLGQHTHVPARAVGAQDQKVEVRVGRQLAAPEAAGGQDRDRRRTFGQMWARPTAFTMVSTSDDSSPRDRNTVSSLAHSLAGAPRADANCCAIVSSISAHSIIPASMIDDGLRVRHG